MLKLLTVTLSLFNTITMNYNNPTINPSELDKTINPANNFYAFVNNKWLNKTEIPDDKSSWGNFHILAEKNELKLKDILDNLADNTYEPNSIQDKLYKFYLSGLDTTTIDSNGFEPLKPYIQKINDLDSPDQLIKFVTTSYPLGLGFLFSNSIYADSKNPNYNALHFFQGGINLPDKDYYLNNDQQNEQIRNAYKVYITKLFTLINVTQQKAQENAETIILLETKIAESHRSQALLRDPNLNYNAFNLTQLQAEIPKLNWAQILNNMQLHTKHVIVSQPDYYKKLSELLYSEPIDNWKVKITFDLLHSCAGFLSKDFRETKFSLYDRLFTGTKKEPERWKQIVRLTNSLMGEAIGKLFVEKHFPKEAKTKMIDLIDNLKIAYANRIKKLQWMNDTTKEKALDKLAAMNYKIGYPDKFKSYDDLLIQDGQFFANILNLSKFEYFNELKKLDKPVDKDEWAMPPATVNAYYSPLHNEIVFPAGILQPPFFDFNASDAENYGAIGVIIGHEITHGFDDQGRKYDLNGQLNNWWTDSDLENFNTKTSVFVKQYDQCVILNQHVNGELTLGENIADLGGLQIALDALKFSKDDTNYSVYTKKQTFFIAYARMWRMKTRDEYMKLRLTIDPHSPEIFRVNIPLSNMDEFYEAFNVKPGDASYRDPDNMAILW